MRISDCSSDVCSSDLSHCRSRRRRFRVLTCLFSVWSSTRRSCNRCVTSASNSVSDPACFMHAGGAIKTTTGVTIMSDIISELAGQFGIPSAQAESAAGSVLKRSEEHTSELQSLMRISYAVFCLKKKNNKNNHCYHETTKTNHIQKQH